MARIRRSSHPQHAHRILVIDDDGAVLESTRSLLARDGHEAVYTTDRKRVSNSHGRRTHT